VHEIISWLDFFATLQGDFKKAGIIYTDNVFLNRE
jgi:hypothetical protein